MWRSEMRIMHSNLSTRKSWHDGKRTVKRHRILSTGLRGLGIPAGRRNAGEVRGSPGECERQMNSWSFPEVITAGGLYLLFKGAGSDTSVYIARSEGHPGNGKS